jgi:hypothetical protein
MNSEQDNGTDADRMLDLATSARLAKLRTRPLDTSSLKRRMASQIPHPRSESRLPWRWVRPLRAVAALVVVTGIAALFFLSTSGGPVLASPAQMAKLHSDLVSGRTPVIQVDSVQEANAALAGESPHSPQLPQLPASYEMACCMKSIHDKKVACLLLKDGGMPVTMTVAKAIDMKLPSSPTVRRAGVVYYLQSSGPLSMVMTERNDRWICLISEGPAERLMDLADQLKF